MNQEMTPAKSIAQRVPLTAYQWCLSVVAYPWLAMVQGPVKPWVALLGWFGWMGALSMAPTKFALIGVSVPLATIMLSLTASVLLLLSREIQRYDANDSAQVVDQPTE
ncbi:hypothetical protein [Acidovorax sp. sic0104]|uniref:hypothetical protein n=1 Tax=Acidovorax sp. sic0104 TaxID=2854784 RepID=UPI001C44B06E|nr:hypothetical protein [Acidovorax sp. sic0104]MBV7542198.1 hypothetical protein [Acidovorax sp. sic0104]